MKNSVPCWIVPEVCSIPQNVQTMFSSRQRHVDAVRGLDHDMRIRRRKGCEESTFKNPIDTFSTAKSPVFRTRETMTILASTDFMSEWRRHDSIPITHLLLPGIRRQCPNVSSTKAMQGHSPDKNAALSGRTCRATATVSVTLSTIPSFSS